MKFSRLFALKLIVLLLFLGLTASAFAEETGSDQNVVAVYFFWAEGCPYCIYEKQFLAELEQKYSQIEIKSYETWQNPDNARLFSEMAKAFGTTAMGVPTTFIDDQVWVGYADYISKEIEEKAKYCIQHGCADPMEKLEKPSASEITKAKETLSPLKEVCVHVFVHGECPQCEKVLPYLSSLAEKYNIELITHDVSEQNEYFIYSEFKDKYRFSDGGYPAVFIGNSYFLGESSIRANLEAEIIACRDKECPCPADKIVGLTPYPPQPKDITPEGSSVVNLPFFGEVDTAAMSMPVFTIIIAGLDSFNPCAFFVLFFLLSLLIYAKNRKGMLLIGFTFVFFSGFIYFLFMAAWLNLFLLIGQLMIITMIAGMIALAVAAINIKDFFFFNKGISLAIPESAKPKLFQRMRNLLKASSLASMMIGTVVLAIAANTYELLCTAGFPMVFTRVLTLQGISMGEYYLYLAFYNLIYVIPLIFIVLMFIVTLGAKKLTEWQGQILKLISGIMMLGLGLVLLIKPALLNNVFVAAGLLAAALMTAAIIIFITKKLRKKGKGGNEDEYSGQA